jgi:hypothetical protein
LKSDSLAEHVRRRELVQHQVAAAFGHAPDRSRTARRHPDRWMRLLGDGRLDHDILELPVAPLVREASGRGPRPDDHGQGLLETRFGLLHRDAEALELVVAITLADAEIEAPAGQQVERRRLLGEQHRVVPRQHQHGGAEPQRRGARP